MAPGITHSSRAVAPAAVTTRGRRFASVSAVETESDVEAEVDANVSTVGRRFRSPESLEAPATHGTTAAPPASGLGRRFKGSDDSASVKTVGPAQGEDTAARQAAEKRAVVARLAQEGREAERKRREELAHTQLLARKALMAKLAEEARNNEAALARTSHSDPERVRAAEQARWDEQSREEQARKSEQVREDELRQAEAARAQEAELAREQEEEAHRAERVRVADEARVRDEARLFEEARKEEALRLAEEVRLAESVRVADESRLRSEAWLYEEARKAEAARVAALAETSIELDEAPEDDVDHDVDHGPSDHDEVSAAVALDATETVQEDLDFFPAPWGDLDDVPATFEAPVVPDTLEDWTDEQTQDHQALWPTEEADDSWFTPFDNEPAGVDPQKHKARKAKSADMAKDEPVAVENPANWWDEDEEEESAFADEGVAPPTWAVADWDESGSSRGWSEDDDEDVAAAESERPPAWSVFDDSADIDTPDESELDAWGPEANREPSRGRPTPRSMKKDQDKTKASLSGSYFQSIFDEHAKVILIAALIVVAGLLVTLLGGVFTKASATPQPAVAIVVTDANVGLYPGAEVL